MSCFGNCLKMDPPPNKILFMPPPPPAPFFLLPELAPINTSHCFAAQICDMTSNWASNKIDVNHGEFIEMPRKDMETKWPMTTMDDTWILILVLSIIAVILLGALLALFLLKCRDGSDQCSLHLRDHQPIKNVDPRECDTLTNLNGKLLHSTENSFFNVQDNRTVWAALTPRGTQHFVSGTYPRNVLNYGDPDDAVHYETVENIASTLANQDFYYNQKKDYDYEDPTPLIENYQMNNMESTEEHDYQIIVNKDMRCANYGYAPNTFKRPSYCVNRPRVSSPTRIEHPNLPPLNLYPQRGSNNNTLKKNTMNYRNADAVGVTFKYGM